jgi:ATP-dependent RNA helicase DHX57
VSTGVCWKIYTKKQFHGGAGDPGFPDHELRMFPSLLLVCFTRVSDFLCALLVSSTAEIQRSPLHQLLLQVAVLKPILVSRNSILFPNKANVRLADVLRQCISPPPGEAIVAASDALVGVNAITERDEELTPLGHHLAQLPVDCHIGKLLLFSAILGCVDPVTTIAAALSYRSPFLSPIDQRDEAQRMRIEMFSAAPGAPSGASSRSDHMSVVHAFNMWRDDSVSGRSERQKLAWSRDRFLSHRTLKMLADLKNQYLDLLRDLAFLPGKHDTEGLATANRHSRHEHVIKAALAAGLYPNILHIASGADSFVETAHGAVLQDKHAKELRLRGRPDKGNNSAVFLHPSSINFQVGKYESNWLCYYEIVQTSKVFVRDTSCVYPLALLLFGGHSTAIVSDDQDAAGARREAMDMIRVDHERGTVSVDRWMHFRAPARICIGVRELRFALDDLLVAKIRHPELDVASRPLVQCIGEIIAADGDQLGAGSN